VTDRRRSLVLAVAAAASALFAVAQAARWAAAARDVTRLRHVVTDRPRPTAQSGDVAAAVTANARPTGVRRIESIAGDGRSRETLVEWDGGFAASVAFLSGVARDAGAAATRVSLAAGDDGTLHGRAAFAPASSAVAPLRVPPRDPFLSRKSAARADGPSPAARRREEEKRRQDVARADAERRAREEGDRRAAALRAFTARYAITGIAADAHGPLAFLTIDRQRSVLARTGDRVDGATVTAIDAAKGEATLSGADAMTVVVRVGGAP